MDQETVIVASVPENAGALSRAAVAPVITVALSNTGIEPPLKEPAVKVSTSFA